MSSSSRRMFELFSDLAQGRPRRPLHHLRCQPSLDDVGNQMEGSANSDRDDQQVWLDADDRQGDPASTNSSPFTHPSEHRDQSPHQSCNLDPQFSLEVEPSLPQVLGRPSEQEHSQMSQKV